MPHEIVSFDEPKLQEYLGELVRKTVEDALNALLDAEADQIANAGRYERTDERQAYRSGHYRRGLTTTCGEVELNVPKLRGATFASKVVERYRRRESSVEEAMMEMYLAGVSTRRIQDVSEILWGSSVSPATVSKLNREAFGAVDEWRHRRLEGDYPYVYLDGTYIKRNWGGAYEGVAVLVAIGVNAEGFREVIGCEEGYVESEGSWKAFLLGLRERGLSGVRMFTGDKSAGMLGAIQEVFRGQGGRVRRRGDADLRPLPAGALEEDPHQQRHRAAEPGDQEAHRRRGELPRGGRRGDAGGGEVQVRSRGRLGLEALP